MILRRETPIDRAAILAVHAAAFAHPEKIVSPEARLVDELRHDGDIVSGLSIVAEANSVVVGHVVCSRARIEDSASLGLGPLGVLPEHQRRGVGHALMYAVLAAADALDEPAVVLLGDPGYYRRFGFMLAQTLAVQPAHPEWTEHFQIRCLSAWVGSTRGTFHCAPAFDRM